MSKKDLQAYLVPYVQGVRARWRAGGKPKDVIQPMMANANRAAAFLMGKVKDCEVFVNADYNMEGAICLREWSEEGNLYYYLMPGLEGGRGKCAF